MKKVLFRKKGLLFLALVLFVSLSLLITQKVSAAEEDDSTVTITLHAGAGGFFGDSSIKEKESIQTKGDLFQEDAVPDPLNESYLFAGWATTPDAIEPDVEPGVTEVDSLGTDIYAVWMVEVLYYAQEGYFEIDGNIYGQMLVYYALGQNFKAPPVYSFSEQLYFDGWYTGIGGKGTKCTEEMVIDQPYQIHAYWLLDKSKILPMETDTDYPISLEASAVAYSFTPDETAVYNIFSKDAVTESQAYIRLLDYDGHRIADADTIGGGNVLLSHELEAGQTYLLEISDFMDQAITLTVRIEKAESAMVTFHANPKEEGAAYFDGDPSIVEKSFRIQLGEDIHSYKGIGLNIADPSTYTFMGWSLDKDALYSDDELIVDGDIDVYGVYEKFDTILLDANGGYFTMPVVSDTQVLSYSYTFDEVFAPNFDPVIDDETKAFSGWATTPDAKESDIQEYVNTCRELPKVVYAVYSETVVVTHDANGGYLMYDPSVTTYQTTVGKGHVYFDMTLYSDDPRMVPLGWKDDKGYEIPLGYTDPDYIINEDVTFTGILAWKVGIDANGGCFEWDPDLTALRLALRTDKPFSQKAIDDLVLTMNMDMNKVLIGWATTPDATEPDVIEGVTPILDLDWIYAVWADDSYYFEEGENGTWEKGSEEGLCFVVKRVLDDTMTYPEFDGFTVDGNTLTPGLFEAKEGSLILTLKPSYLETLETGKHNLTISFGDVPVSTEFEIKEKEEPVVPDEPSEPDKTDPVTPDKQDVTPVPTPKPAGKAPVTGDENDLMAWTWLMIFALAGISIPAFGYVKKRKRS